MAGDLMTGTVMPAASNSEAQSLQQYVRAVEGATKEVPAYLLEIADLDKQGKIIQDSVRAQCAFSLRLI